MLSGCGKALGSLQQGQRGSVGCVATGPEPHSSSFRSVQSGISWLAEMLLSLCQIRSGCDSHVTAQQAASCAVDTEMEALVAGRPSADGEWDQNRSEG